MINYFSCSWCCTSMHKSSGINFCDVCYCNVKTILLMCQSAKNNLFIILFKEKAMFLNYVMFAFFLNLWNLDKFLQWINWVWAHKTILTLPLFIEVPVPSQEIEWSWNCVLEVSILPLSTILIFDFGNVLTVWYIWFFILPSISKRK